MVAAPDPVVLDDEVAEQITSQERRDLLDTIDELRDLGVGNMINLPQIVVVGDQSSGKSSVLNAISRVKFPISEGLCTRFATELVLRKAETNSTAVRIRFANERDSSRATFWRNGFDRESLPKIVEEAKSCMGIHEGSSKGFSQDVLRIEISGPDIYPLTLIDLPGIFQSTSSTQSQEGKLIVDKLVDTYMKQTNSVILMVVTAGNQYANQAILDKSKAYDPDRQRTMGVITKPDLAGPAYREEYIKLVKGNDEAHRLSLGWHVLRNRSEGEADSTAEERDSAEDEFFQTSNTWGMLPPSTRGIKSLRKKLGDALLKQIKQGLPRLVQNVEENLHLRLARLERLGNPRDNARTMRSYLLNIAVDFHRISRDAVDGRYDDGFFGGADLDREAPISKQRKLRAMLRNLNRAFDVTLVTKGATFEIGWEQSSPDDGNDPILIPSYLKPFVELYKFPHPQALSESDLKAQLEGFASANQGLEFPGTPNVALIMQLFRYQARPWKQVAEAHLNLVLQQTRAFVHDLLGHIVDADDKTRDAILVVRVNRFFESKYEELQAKLDEILLPFTHGHGLPLEPEFRKGLAERDLGRMAHQIASQLENDFECQNLSRDGILQSVQKASGFNSNEFGTQGVVNMMLTHYDMSLRTFTENVIHLAIESCLVCQVPDILTPACVDQLADKELEELAEESEDIRFERQQLNDQAEMLRKGLEKCRRYKVEELPRGNTFDLTQPLSSTRGILQLDAPKVKRRKTTGMHSSSSKSRSKTSRSITTEAATSNGVFDDFEPYA